MKHTVFTLVVLFILFSSCCTAQNNPFWNEGQPVFEIQELFSDERFPNVVTATDGTIVATWGRENFRVRRSEDGGKTWEAEEATIKPNSLGHIPSMHMNEHGITLKNGKFVGRLIRPSRWYGNGNGREFWDEHYTNAIYSDDGGKTWQASEPFPAYGTGEAAIEELSDGTLYYNSRRHKSTDGLNPRKRYIATSYDGGQTWKDLSVSEELPDGDQNRDYGLMAGLVRLPIEGQDILLFSNIESPDGRHHGTVWASFDGGKTWPVKRLADEGNFAYSSLTAGPAGTSSEGMIYLFYESEGGGKIARFNLAWVTEEKDWKEFVNQ